MRRQTLGRAACALILALCSTLALAVTPLAPVLYLGAAPPPSGNLALDLSYVDKSSAAYVRFKAYVDQAVAGNTPYNFSGVDAAILYRLDGASKYADLAVRFAEAQVSAAESAIAAGNAPSIAGDSYLDVGPMLSEIAFVYAWMPEKLTAAQKTRFKAYADQAVFNVWNHNAAKWGSKAFTWSGWCADPMDAGDNYFYSFLTASGFWALASANAAQLSFVTSTLMPALESYFAVLPDGGSLEGTGYGASHKNLFAFYEVWKDSGFTLGPNVTQHATNSIRYWAHATLPGLGYYAPFGDLSRDSTPSLFDYHRQIVLEARYLTGDAAARAIADFWLSGISVQTMQQGFESRFDLLPHASAPSPAALTYTARGVGHVFSRSSWASDAIWFAFAAGTLNQSHEGHQQGAFHLWHNGWLTVTGNIYSHSGIQQSVKLNNVLRFEKAGAVLEERDGTATSTVSAGSSPGDVSIVANLTPVSPSGTTWQRKATFAAGTLAIEDSYSAPAGTIAVFQFIVPTQPTISGNVITTPALKVTVQTPGAVITATTLSAIDSDFGSGYRVDVKAGSGTYQLTFEAR